MANKTQSGQLFSRRSMNGIIEIDDGAGTLISGGEITTDNINTTNLTSDFIQANNLLEADVDETITGKWSFTQAPYITATPTQATEAINKGYADGAYATTASLSQYITDASANETFQPISLMSNYVDLTTNQTIFGGKVFASDFACTTRIDANNILMFPDYTPTTAFQVATKQYVDNLPTGITQAQADALYVGLTGNQSIYGEKFFWGYTTFNAPVDINSKLYAYGGIEMNFDYAPQISIDVATKGYVDSVVAGGGLTNASLFPSSSNTRLQDLTATPTTILGGFHTLLGYRSGSGTQTSNASANSFVGYQAGKGNNGGSNNSFLGAYSGMVSATSSLSFAFNYTTCVGAFSYPNRDNQIVLGKSVDEVRIRGTLLGTSAVFDSITAGTFTITTTNNGTINVSNALNMLNGSVLNIQSGATLDVNSGGAFNISGGTTNINYAKIQRGVYTYRDAGQTNIFPAIVSSTDDFGVSMRNVYATADPDEYCLAMRSNGEVILNGKTCVIAQNNIRKVFFEEDDAQTFDRVFFTSKKAYFGGELYTFINGVYYEILSTSTAYIKSVSDTRFLRTENVAQSIEGTKNFTGTLNVDGLSFFYGDFRAVGNAVFNTQPFYKPVNISYKLLSELDAYTKTQIDAFNYSSNSSFYSASNTRLQDPNDAPVAFSGNNNTIVGYRAGYDTQGSFNNVNTFLGYYSGRYFQAGGLQGGTLNNFIGAYAGWNNPSTTPYAFNRTTCIGAYSYATQDNQVVLGSVGDNVVVRGGLQNTGTSLFEDIATFTAEAYRVISGTTYKILSELDATAYQTIANLATTTSSSNTRYYSSLYTNNTFFAKSSLTSDGGALLATDKAYSTFYLKPIIDNLPNIYQLISRNTIGFNTNASNYYNVGYINSTFDGLASIYQTISDMSNYLTTAVAATLYQTKIPTQLSTWRYGIQTTSTGANVLVGSGTSFWTGTSAQGYSRFRTGASSTGEADTQLDSSTGFFTATIEGMYQINIQITTFPTSSAQIYVDFTDSTGVWGSLIVLRTAGTYAAAGANTGGGTNGMVNNFDLPVFLNAGNNFRIRFASSAFVYSYNRTTFMSIVRTTGY